MERRKLFPMVALALCLTIALSIQPVIAQYSQALGSYQLRLSGSGVIVDMSTGKIVGWNARLTGAVAGLLEVVTDSGGEVKWIHSTDNDVNLYFSWTRSPFGFGKMGYSWAGYIPEIDFTLNPPYPLANSMTWKANFNINYGPLQAPISLTVRWYAPYAPGRMGTISGTYKGPIPLPEDGPLVFVPTGTFSCGIRISGAAILQYIAYPV